MLKMTGILLPLTFSKMLYPSPNTNVNIETLMGSSVTRSLLHCLNPCHTRVASFQRSHSVKKVTDCRGMRCAVTSNDVCALCNHLERLAQNNRRVLGLAQRVRQRFGDAVGASSAPWVRCGRAACTL